MKIEANHKLWVDVNNLPYSDEVLRVLSKTWTRETWEDYLTSFEKENSESVISPGQFSKRIEEASLNAFLASLFQGDVESTPNLSPDFKSKLAAALSDLSFRQRKVLRKIFWENKLVCEVAEGLKTSPPNIIQIRDAALSALKNALKVEGDRHG